ncbi:MAG: adenylate/guanylate cyclase domain-containing protein [Flavobacteriales bacterium]|nr:adenylate/guanylate cyclase domain-containing protein [Flavobacteriales bacterium]
MSTSSVSDYRSRARHFAFRYPVLSEIIIQVNFWILANVLLVTLIHQVINAVSKVFTSVVNLPYWPQFWMAVGAAIIYGTMLGLIDYTIERKLTVRLSLGQRILLKTLAYTGALVIIIGVTIYLHRLVFAETFARMGLAMTMESELGWAAVLSIYCVVANLLISFIKQVNNTFGPGVLMPLLLGRYRKPVVERRIFMFMDLRASTTYAEQLGHLKYSSMVRDLFHDVNTMVPKHDAEIYQYVGDEVVFTWSVPDGLHNGNCLTLFHAVSDAIRSRSDEYRRNYGLVPEFKAGLHVGDVTAVEIGEIKREIAYHGDTVNTAARIQGVCNEFGRELLVSDELLVLFDGARPNGLLTEPVGSVLLKGKQEYVTIHGIERGLN